MTADRVRTPVLCVDVDAVTFDGALRRLTGVLDGAPGDKGAEPFCVYTPNPEMIMRARADKAFARALNGGDLVVPDGIGVVLASRLTAMSGAPALTERVPGCDLAQALMAREKGLSVYLLGAKPGVCEAAKRNLESRFPRIKIAGFRHGYFKDGDDAERAVIDEIRALAPDLLLAGLGSPRQELWISAHRRELPVKVIMGVGGSLDVFAGAVRRAPAAFRRLGLEWFYRLITQPARALRMRRLPAFMLLVILKALGMMFKELSRNKLDR